MQRVLPISPGTLQESLLNEAVDALVAGGVRQLLLREPLLACDRIRELLERHREMKVIVHERCPGAHSLASGQGWGLHLSSSTDVGGVRSGFEGLLGVSTHSGAGLVKAESEGADYALLSPLYTPYSKPGDVRTPLGLERAAAAIGRVSIPVFVLGGIDAQRARDCRTTGAYGVAAVGALFGVGVDTTAAAKTMLSVLD